MQELLGTSDTRTASLHHLSREKGGREPAPIDEDTKPRPQNPGPNLPGSATILSVPGND